MDLDDSNDYPEVDVDPAYELDADADLAGDDYHTLVSSLRGTRSETTLPPLTNSASKRAASVKPTHSSSQSSPDLALSPYTPADAWIQRKLKVWRMHKTLEMFEAEWADLKDAGQLPTAAQIGSVPSEQLTNHAAANEHKIIELEYALNKTGNIANQARESWEKLKRERDYHRMHHSRVLQEKEILIRDLKRLKKHYETFEPTLMAMKAKYEVAMKDKMMMRLERDRCKVKSDALEAQMKSWEQAAGNSLDSKEPEIKPKSDKELSTSKKLSKTSHGSSKDSVIPPSNEIRDNPYAHTTFEPVLAHEFQLRKTFKGHRQAISAMCLHPKKSILCTVSDDQTWKMWSIPKGDLIMSGEGHRDWISSCEFHPSGSLLATASGDGTVKLWDFMKAVCSYTFAEHTQAVWDVAFHEQGDFLVSASMDHTSKLWDLNSQRCRQTFRGHVDSVNSVCFQPFTNNICTASGDKTVSLWDMRSGLCVQTFYGHQNAVTDASFNLNGDTIISADADGVVKMWDVRLVGEKANFRSMGNQAVNEAKIDRSGLIAALASDDGTIKMSETTARRDNATSQLCHALHLSHLCFFLFSFLMCVLVSPPPMVLISVIWMVTMMRFRVFSLIRMANSSYRHHRIRHSEYGPNKQQTHRKEETSHTIHHTFFV